MAGCTDLWESRRTLNDKVEYWHRDDSWSNLSEYVDKTVPAGIFRAREETPRYGSKQNQMGAFMFDAHSVTLFTTDDIDIKAGDLVRHRGSLWRVEDVQETREIRETEFMSRTSAKRYIRIRK